MEYLAIMEPVATYLDELMFSILVFDSINLQSPKFNQKLNADGRIRTYAPKGKLISSQSP